MEKPAFKVNGKEYPVPTDLTLGEMCDAERFFGVEFGSASTSGVRMAAALLYIAVRREDPTVTVDDIRELPPEVFADVGDARPPDEAAERNDSPGPSGGSSSTGSESLDGAPQPTGIPA